MVAILFQQQNLLKVLLKGKIAKPNSKSEDDGDDIPLNNLEEKKDVLWKWNKCFERAALKKCSYAEEGIVNINLENPSPCQVSTETIGL